MVKHKYYYWECPHPVIDKSHSSRPFAFLYLDIPGPRRIFVALPCPLDIDRRSYKTRNGRSQEDSEVLCAQSPEI